MLSLFSTKISRICITSILSVILFGTNAHAWQYKHDRFALRVTGYGTGGLIEPDFGEPVWLGDWDVRAQANFAVSAGQTVGFVYDMNQIAIDNDQFFHELFALFEDRNLGRIELGLTHSVARKLSVGLPDVGGLRVNEAPLFYSKISPDGTVIADTSIISGHDALRTNIVSVPTRGVQYGLSLAGLSDKYKWGTDIGIKFRQPSGKLKLAYSFAMSFMDKPDGYRPEYYSPRVDADWRTQMYGGMNLQYNSWIFGLSARAIYDKNPTGTVSDGISVGTGISYDLLRYSLSLSYILSDTGVWDSNVQDYIDHTVIGSFRYKYSENLDGWTSLGMTTKTPFVSAGIKIHF